MDAPTKKLSELATITPGFSPKSADRKKSGQYLLLGGRNIQDGKLVTTELDSYVDGIDRESFRSAIARAGDVIISTLFDRRKLYLYEKGDPSAVVNNSCAIIRAGQQSDYIVSYLRTVQGADDFLERANRATKGNVIRRVSTNDLREIEIPILPIEKLSRLGDTRIERTSPKQLLELQRELESKNTEIEKLRAEHASVVRFYEDRLQAVKDQLATDSLLARIKHGETATLEFKSSLRYNIRTKKIDKDIENSVLKTIVAFCNTKGGEVLIGVTDDKSIVGIEHDGFSNEDKFQLHLRNLLMSRIIPSVAELVEFSMATIEGSAICQVTCKPSRRQEIWLKPEKDGRELFFVRIGPSSTELQPRQALSYIREHFEPV